MCGGDETLHRLVALPGRRLANSHKCWAASSVRPLAHSSTTSVSYQLCTRFVGPFALDLPLAHSREWQTTGGKEHTHTHRDDATTSATSESISTSLSHSDAKHHHHQQQQEATSTTSCQGIAAKPVAASKEQDKQIPGQHPSL